jgi:hypothetical protein
VVSWALLFIARRVATELVRVRRFFLVQIVIIFFIFLIFVVVERCVNK